MVNQPVLIVDDEVEMRIAMSETLKHCGYPVEISHNAIDALKKFKQNNYSPVITDMTMPKRSGLELLKDIKSISPANQLLMDWVVESGKQLDIDVRFKDTGGCCDGNNLAAVGLPNVDTLGVLGGQIHTADEFMLIDSLTERAKLSLNILQKISEEGDRLQALSKRDKKN